MKILNMFNLHFCSPVSNWSIASPNPTKCDLVYDIKLLPTVYFRIYVADVLTLSNQTSHYKSMCLSEYRVYLHIWNMRFTNYQNDYTVTCDFSNVEHQLRLMSLIHMGIGSQYSLVMLCFGYHNGCLQRMHC